MAAGTKELPHTERLEAFFKPLEHFDNVAMNGRSNRRDRYETRKDEAKQAFGQDEKVSEKILAGRESKSVYCTRRTCMSAQARGTKQDAPTIE